MKLDEMMEENYKIKGGSILHIIWEENLDLICKLDLKYESCNCLMESKQSL